MTSITQSLFKRFAKRDVALGHLRRQVAILEERQNPFDPSGTLNRVVSLGALRSGALTSRIYRSPGGFCFRGKNRNEARSIDVDERVQERFQIRMELQPAR